ncbi:MAG TPA: hypothetical protein VGS03_13125 [Candidatus Polarisedimenticolia bacterium]|jgi:N-acetylneuraminic acid mutarotase|nr:hypothetical protein [Candidatus Polarisedimenticolia bacterium]
MRARPMGLFLVAFAAFRCVASSEVFARDLTFDERVKAQEAIERVYYAHQIGAKKPFDEAVPRAVLEAQVHTSLKQSAALQRYWKTPITPGDLAREMERMERNTRLGDRLREIFGALGNDRRLILECLARPALADRLARDFFAFDRTIHGAERQRAEGLRRLLESGDVAASDDHPLRTVVEFVRADLGPDESSRVRATAPEGVGAIGAVKEEREAFVIRVVLHETSASFSVATYAVPKITWDSWWTLHEPELDPAATVALDATAALEPAPRAPACEPGGIWNHSALEVAPEGRFGHSAVWTGSEMIVWGGESSTYYNTGARYDPATDSWSDISTTNAPTRGSGHTAIWTGAEMIVWGKNTLNGAAPVPGGRYNPATDTWSPVSQVDAPDVRSSHTAVWTGTRMIVWGGISIDPLANRTALASGGQYDPLTDSWSPTSMTGAPEARFDHTAVWTGNAMIVWGGTSSGSLSLDSGARYDPATDTWSPTSSIAAPQRRADHEAVWTGSEMIVWGGAFFTTPLDSGGRYDPSSDTWRATPALPSAGLWRRHASAVWTGTEMIVWGGFGGATFFERLDTGVRYQPATDSWRVTSTINAPVGRHLHTAIWTGSLMIVWGGQSEQSAGDLNSGGRYDPVTDSWSPTYITSGPAARGRHTAVWTGSRMIVWGGQSTYGLAVSGGRYDPATDTWSAVSSIGAPSALLGHTAIWTGDEMIIWGGGATLAASGGRYDPITDTWLPVSTTSAPPAHFGHTAVWTGTMMVVWGGTDGYGRPLMSGGRYEPEFDTWSPMAMPVGPIGLVEHTAVWTGTEMIVWGGSDGVTEPPPGGRYDPLEDRWSPMTPRGDLPAPWGHTALWTGSRMLVWGGVADPNPGGVYDPESDTWTPMSPVDAPEPRRFHTTVWTGTEMVAWGGTDRNGVVDTGVRYDPHLDLWLPVSTIGAPRARYGHTAVWTGDEMIVWGGTDAGSGHLGSGGRFALLPTSGPLIAEAGADQVVECGQPVPGGGAGGFGAGVTGMTQVRLRGSATGCGGLTFTWTGPFSEGGGRIEGSEVVVTLPRGAHQLTLEVEDEIGRRRADTLLVTVRDTVSPGLALTTDPTTLWPPQHAMVPVHVTARASDSCDPNPRWSLVSVTSSEPDDLPGVVDGSTVDDIQGADLGTADDLILLRAERNRRGSGRRYDLVYRVVDAAGNAREERVTVLVPLSDKRGPRTNGH